MSDSTKSMSQIFDKIDDLKAIFKFGERVVPIISSLIEFMKDVVPLLEKINLSIADSTNQMPEASNQINDVTSATELATTEILDLVDEISNELIGIGEVLDDVLERHAKRQELAGKLKEAVKDNPEASGLLDEYISLDNKRTELEEVKTKVDKINEDSYKITLSLQVQDITSQQLAAVNHLIQSVNTRLGSLVKDIDSSDLRAELNELSEKPANVHFDKNAKYVHDQNRQNMVDEIMNEQNNGSPGEKTSQAEIDKLFS